MSSIGRKLRLIEGGLVAFHCPGCETGHNLRIEKPGAPHPCWKFNGNGDAPTFTPSIRVTGTDWLTDEEHAAVMRGEHVEPRPTCCHSHVTDGKIQFLDDCTHALRGQTVPLPDYPR